MATSRISLLVYFLLQGITFQSTIPSSGTNSLNMTSYVYVSQNDGNLPQVTKQKGLTIYGWPLDCFLQTDPQLPGVITANVPFTLVTCYRLTTFWDMNMGRFFNALCSCGRSDWWKRCTPTVNKKQSNIVPATNSVHILLFAMIGSVPGCWRTFWMVILFYL